MGARVNLLGVMLALIGLSAATLAARLLGLDLRELIALQPEPPAFISGLAVFGMLFGPLTVLSGILILLGVRASRRPFLADPGLGAALLRLFGPEFVRAAPPLGGGTLVAGVWIATRAFQMAPAQDLTSLQGLQTGLQAQLHLSLSYGRPLEKYMVVFPSGLPVQGMHSALALGLHGPL